MGARRFGIFFAIIALVGTWWWLRGSAPADTPRAIVPRERAAAAAPTIAADPVKASSMSAPVDATASPATSASEPSAAPRTAGTNAQVGPAVSVGAVPSSRPRVETPAVANAEMRLSLDRVRNSLRDYRALFGENPVGTNADIMQALNGNNPRQARLGPDGMTSNEAGELVDQWGTPIFFHQLSKDQMEIISAGPDQVMGTADDILVR
jgi:hypothetical protein